MQNSSYADQTLSGTFIKDGKGVPGVQVQLLLSGVHQDTDVTDKDGFWSFDITVGGSYEVRFFGSGATREDDWILDLRIESFGVGTLDNIADGATYKRVIETEKTGAGRAYQAINEDIRIVRSIYDATGTKKLLDVNDAGNLGRLVYGIERVADENTPDSYVSSGDFIWTTTSAHIDFNDPETLKLYKAVYIHNTDDILRSSFYAIGDSGAPGQLFVYIYEKGIALASAGVSFVASAGLPLITCDVDVSSLATGIYIMIVKLRSTNSVDDIAVTNFVSYILPPE